MSFPCRSSSRSARPRGREAIGLEEWPEVEADLAHPSLAGVAGEEVEAALVFGSGADVFA